MLMIKIDEIAKISNRELIKGIEAMKPEDYYWLKDRLNLMKTFREQIWHFNTSAFMLSKRELEAFEILEFLKVCNKIQNTFLNKLKKLK